MATDLIKTAEKNRNYYLTEQKADNDENKWFRYIKTMDSYSEPILISPRMAKEIIGYCEDDFDLRKPKTIRTIAKELETSHSTIAFSFAGKLLDGRLILEAILLNKKSAIVFVSFNVPDKLSFLFEQQH